MYRKYKDRGLVIVGFPSNDFSQEPGTQQGSRGILPHHLRRRFSAVREIERRAPVGQPAVHRPGQADRQAAEVEFLQVRRRSQRQARGDVSQRNGSGQSGAHDADRKAARRKGCRQGLTWPKRRIASGAHAPLKHRQRSEGKPRPHSGWTIRRRCWIRESSHGHCPYASVKLWTGAAWLADQAARRSPNWRNRRQRSANRDRGRRHLRPRRSLAPEKARTCGHAVRGRCPPGRPHRHGGRHARREDVSGGHRIPRVQRPHLSEADRAVRRARRNQRRQRDVVLVPYRPASAGVGRHQPAVTVRATRQCAASGVLAHARRHRALQPPRHADARRRPRVVDHARRVPRRGELFGAIP